MVITFHWDIDDISTLSIERVNCLKRSCILLPLLSEKGVWDPSGKDVVLSYTSIADDYTEIDEKGKFVKRSLDYTDF